MGKNNPTTLSSATQVKFNAVIFARPAPGLFNLKLEPLFKPYNYRQLQPGTTFHATVNSLPMTTTTTTFTTYDNSEEQPCEGEFCFINVKLMNQLNEVIAIG